MVITIASTVFCVAGFASINPRPVKRGNVEEALDREDTGDASINPCPVKRGNHWLKAAGLWYHDASINPRPVKRGNLR